jgi:hypothetical protein
MNKIKVVKKYHFLDSNLTISLTGLNFLNKSYLDFGGLPLKKDN